MARLDYAERQAARKERYEQLAASKKAKGVALHDSGMKALEQIPFGQPILVGHHSERGDRAYRARSVATVERGFAEMQKADYYASKAESVGTAGISSDDPEAIPKLKAKLEAMQAKWDEIKRQRKEGKDVWAWGVSTANIRNIKKRIEQLEKLEKTEAKPDIIGKSYIIRENKDVNRIQFLFDSKPSEAVRDIMKHNGFRWSPSESAWQTHLTNRGRWSADRAAKAMDNLPPGYDIVSDPKQINTQEV